MGAVQTGESSVSKEGEVTDVTVSDWLKNSGDISSDVEDSSDLTDVKNGKGDETFTQDGNTLTWNKDGQDIYYQGKTQRDLPVSVGMK